MTLMTREKENEFQMVDYKRFIKKMIEKGALFSLFKQGTMMIRDMTSDDTPEFTQEMIVEFLNLLKEVTDDCLNCPKCYIVYAFRVCTGLSYDHNNAIELTCGGCGDCYSHSEKKVCESYFNIMAWKEVDNLRRRSKGFTIVFRLGGPNKATLCVYNDKGKRPEIWINGYQIFEPEVVRMYWNSSKELIKQWRLGKDLEVSYTQTENEKIYVLDNVKEKLFVTKS
ncbi:hypothetical protein J2T13_003969 [Paenibacillus sp. DS2015]|uniref:hypothetical protein n=1 Tax=Paenibacillus sp. DS2015 TaxID=3373917 RepID=UPI003D2363D2